MRARDAQIVLRYFMLRRRGWTQAAALRSLAGKFFRSGERLRTIVSPHRPWHDPGSLPTFLAALPAILRHRLQTAIPQRSVPPGPGRPRRQCVIAPGAEADGAAGVWTDVDPPLS
jgi:hypothetical protein